MIDIESLYEAKFRSIFKDHELNEQTQLYTQCPICKEKISFNFDNSLLQNIHHYPFPHIVLHGTPIHAIILYLDANLVVRGVECSQSIEVSRNSDTIF